MKISKIIHTAATVIAMSLLYICSLLAVSPSSETWFSFTALVVVLITVVSMVSLIVTSNKHSKSLSSIIILVLLIAELVFSLIVWKNDSKRMGAGSVLPYLIHPIIGLAANAVCIIVKKVKDADLICDDYLTFESWIDIIAAIAAAAIGCLALFFFNHFLYCWIIILALLVFRMVHLIKTTWSVIKQ